MTRAPLDEQPLFDRIRELNAEVALLRKEAREDRAELRVALAATPAPLDGRRTAAAATFAEALHRDVPWFVGGSQDAENAMIDAIEAEARRGRTR